MDDLREAVSFICTGRGGRGTHDSAIPVRQATPGTGGRAQASTWLQCPVCTREVRLGHHVMQQLAASGLRQVDISALPF